MKTCTVEEVRAVKSRAIEVFRPLADVVGVGITRVGEGYGLKVNLQCTPRNSAALPREVDGVPVRIEIVGTVRKQLKSQGSSDK
jgi:hypothetical protein